MWKKHLNLYQKLSGMSRYFRIALVTVQSQGVVLSTWKLHLMNLSAEAGHLLVISVAVNFPGKILP